MSNHLTADEIIAARKRLGLTQAEFAARINEQVPGLAVNTVTVSRWENRKHSPSPVAAAAIRRLCDQVPT